MNWFFGSLVGAKRWMCSRVGRRLGFAFSMVTLLMVLMAVVSGWQLWQLDRQFATVLDDRLHKLSALQRLDTELNALNLAARDAIIGADSDTGKAAVGRIEAGRTRIGQQIEDLQKMLKGEGAESVAIAERLGNDSSGILVTMVKFSRLHKAGRMDAARALFGSQLQPQMHGLSSTVSQVQALQMTGFELAKQQAHGGMHAALATNGAMLSLALVLSGLFAWRLSLSITRPMVEAVRLAESVASGDLSSLVRVHCTDEVGRLLQAMAAMQLRLGEMVNGIRSSVDGIKRTSVEIASGNHDLSLRTERTAKSLQSTALAMEQLSATVSQSTQSACSVHELVSNASQRAEQGGHVVSEVVANMQQIAQSSHRIGDIIGVIDGIAFQTNILALNAAVEAARAGEQGRGFAVVAAEVRALAQRSAAAAKEIKVLIEASVDKVGQGSKLVDQAGQTMQDLMSQVHGVSDLISSITTASQAQSDGVGQVSGAVIELDQATKQNASLVHETSRSAGHLQSESERLYEAVSVFKLAS